MFIQSKTPTETIRPVPSTQYFTATPQTPRMYRIILSELVSHIYTLKITSYSLSCQKKTPIHAHEQPLTLTT
jgi:hypothetical protein